MAVPYIAAQGPATTFLGLPGVATRAAAAFGAVDNRRRTVVLQQGRCQICSHPLAHTAVYLVRPVDRLHGWTAEPALHEECFRYSRAACPMLAGCTDHHRRTPANLRHLTAPGQPGPSPARTVVGSHEPGRPADAFDAWWVPLTQYQLRLAREDGELLGLELEGIVPTRTEHVRDAAEADSLGEAYRFVDTFQSLMAGPGSADACPARDEEDTAP